MYGIPTMTNPNIIGVPLPNENKYAEVIHQAKQSEGIDSPEGMEKAIERLRARNIKFAKLVQLAERVGMVLEPVDRSTGTYVDDERVTTKAVKYGMAFGGLVVPQLHGDIAPIDKVELNLPIDLEAHDEFQLRHVISEYLIDLGCRAVSMMGVKAEEELAKVEESVVHDVTKQRMFRVGYGIVSCYALEAHMRHNEILAEEDRKQLNDKLEAGEIDWDAGLEDLLNQG